MLVRKGERKTDGGRERDSVSHDVLPLAGSYARAPLYSILNTLFGTTTRFIKPTTRQLRITASKRLASDIFILTLRSNEHHMNLLK